ncbi:MAG: F0F1 ATP synthase subunit B [Oscillospiraceae bacterium]|jgi:F-type H+-transporting ATPase subunit b|nr:F0F1 ATP synthase subunit B [Oscillospiraceae bacterium]
MQEFMKLLSLRDILLHVLNVVILFVAIRLLLYRPIRKFMDARSQRVNDQMREAAEAGEQAKARQVQLDEEAQQAKVDAAQAIAEGVRQGQKTGEEIVGRAHKQADLIVGQANEEARRIQLDAKEAVRAQAVNMAVEIAGKMLEREVKLADHEKIVEQFLTKVG